MSPPGEQAFSQRSMDGLTVFVVDRETAMRLLLWAEGEASSLRARRRTGQGAIRTTVFVREGEVA